MVHIRKAAVAGAFYPDDPKQLAHDIEGYLAQATPPRENKPLKVLIAPHAGYVFSGAVAASAYVQLLPIKDQIKRVVLLGPCHRVAVQGLALSSADCFDTPLGPVEIDKAFCRELSALPQIITFDATHEQEHSLEVHLPFLKKALHDFKLVPLVVGQATPDQVAEVLDHAWGGPETLIVISTDLSHFLDYDSCKALDDRTIKAIETLTPEAIGDDQACGRIPLKGLLQLAKARGLSIETLDVKNSGDTAGPRNRVVGYASFALYEETVSRHEAFSRKTRAMLHRHGGSLLQISAAVLKQAVRTKAPLDLDLTSFPAELQRPGASFVTLEKHGQLRGCIGSLSAHQAVAKDVGDNSFKAGFQDPRFKPLEQDELKDLSIHISLLSEAFALSFEDEADLLAQLRPFKDGLIIEDQGRRALFLPSVWEKLPDKTMFLSHLRQKAGLAATHWSSTFRAYRFVSEGVGSEQLDAPEKLWQDRPQN